jgi:hypothetical protein
VAAGVRNRTLSTPAVFYLHPYELYPEGAQMRHRPRRAYSKAVAILERMNLKKNPKKIRRLLTEFRFDRLDKHLPSTG